MSSRDQCHHETNVITRPMSSRGAQRRGDLVRMTHGQGRSQLRQATATPRRPSAARASARRCCRRSGSGAAVVPASCAAASGITTSGARSATSTKARIRAGAARQVASVAAGWLFRGTTCGGGDPLLKRRLLQTPPARAGQAERPQRVPFPLHHRLRIGLMHHRQCRGPRYVPHQPTAGSPPAERLVH